MLKERRQQERRSDSPTCLNCKIKMEKIILKMHFPRGSLPVEGFKCHKCGDEIIDARTVEEYQHLAQKLGLIIIQPI